MIDIYIGGNSTISKDLANHVLRIANEDPTVESVVSSLAYIPFIANASQVKDYAFINHKTGSYYPELIDLIIKDCHTRYGQLIAGYVLTPSNMMIKNYGLQQTVAKMTQLANLCNFLKKESKIHIHPAVAQYDHEFETILDFANNNANGVMVGSPKTPLSITSEVLGSYEQKISSRTSILSDSVLSSIRKQKDGYNYAVSIKNLNK